MSSGDSTVSRLQCTDNECHGVCVYALSTGVYVSSHTPSANLHGLCRTGIVFL